MDIKKKQRVLKKGMKINFFGTDYIINKVLDYDKVEVIMNNGVSINLWFPDLPGRFVYDET